MANEDRLSLSNPPGGPSFDNFSDLVTALKLQFLQGVPPTPENINRAQAGAESAAIQQLSNPDAGASAPQPVASSGGAGGAPIPPSLGAPPTAPIAPQRPPIDTQPNTVPPSIEASSFDGGDQGLPSNGGGLDIAKILALVAAGGLTATQRRPGVPSPNFPQTGPAATPDINPSVEP